jgi:hypothetical protein
MDDFAFVPDTGPPRLIRYVDSSALPSNDIVSMLIAKDNLLLVNLHLYEQLGLEQREKVLRTKHQFLEMKP